MGVGLPGDSSASTALSGPEETEEEGGDDDEALLLARNRGWLQWEGDAETRRGGAACSSGLGEGLEGAEGGAVRLCCSWDGWRQGGRPATLFIAASGREGRAGPAGPTSWLGWPKP